jgi:hypothetical protein
VTRGHGLNQLQRLATANFPDHDAIRPHAQRGLEQVPDGDLALAAGVCRPPLELHHVRLLQLQLARIFDHHHAIALRDERGQTVEQARLARARAAGDDDVLLGRHERREQLRGIWRERSEREQLLDRERILRKAPDRHRRAIRRNRRKQRLDA